MMDMLLILIVVVVSHTSKFITLYNLNMFSVLYVTYIFTRLKNSVLNSMRELIGIQFTCEHGYRNLKKNTNT